MALLVQSALRDWRSRKARPPVAAHAGPYARRAIWSRAHGAMQRVANNKLLRVRNLHKFTPRNVIDYNSVKL